MWILLKISQNTAMPTFALATVLPFDSTGCGTLAPEKGGDPPKVGRIPQPVLLNELTQVHRKRSNPVHLSFVVPGSFLNNRNQGRTCILQSSMTQLYTGNL